MNGERGRGAGAVRWQGRVTKDWRFYFFIQGDTYVLQDITRHAK